MEEKLNKNKKILLILGVMFLLVLLIGSTFAYFAVNTSDTSTSTVITGKTEKVGNATLSTLVTSLHINLSATDMAVTNAGKYYATKEEGKDYEPNKSAGYYDLAQLSLTSDDAEDNNIYTCKTTLKVTLDKEIADNMVNDLQTGDVIFHTFVNGHNTDYDLSTIKETGTLSQDIEIETVGSNTKNIRGYLEFTNKKEDDQSDLAGKNLKVTIETEGLSCEVTGKAVEADKEKIRSLLIDDSHGFRNINFVDYINEDGNELQDLSKAQDESIKGWIEDGEDGWDKNVYIGSNDKIFIKDMSELLENHYDYLDGVDTINLENITFDRTINLSNFLQGYYWKASIPNLILPKNIDTSKVTDVSWMFQESPLDTQEGDKLDINFLDTLDTSNVTDMSNMFFNAVLFGFDSIDLSNFDTSNVTNMSNMFNYFQSIVHLDLSSFDTSKVTDMSEMFSGCSSLKHLDLRSFDFKTASENNGLTDIFSRTKDLVVIVKDEEQKGYIQAEADKAGVTIKIAGQE